MISNVRTSRVLCTYCSHSFANIELHRRKDVRCGRLAALDVAQECEDNSPAEPEEDGLSTIIDQDAAADVADGLAHLKYERGFQRPDVQAAKDFAGVVGKRSRELAFDSLQGLLQPDVSPADVEAGVCTLFRWRAGLGHGAGGRSLSWLSLMTDLMCWEPAKWTDVTVTIQGSPGFLHALFL